MCGGGSAPPIGNSNSTGAAPRDWGVAQDSSEYLPEGHRQSQTFRTSDGGAETQIKLALSLDALG